MVADNILRKLGFIESQMALSHRYMGGTTQSTQAVVIDGALLELHIRESMIAITKKYNAFTLTISESEGHLVFVPSENQIYDESIFFEYNLSQSDLTEVILTEVDHTLDDTKFLWRLTVHGFKGGSRYLLLLTVHHSIIDGDGCIRVLNELLANVDSLGRGKNLAESSVIGFNKVEAFLPLNKNVKASSDKTKKFVEHSNDCVLAERKTCIVTEILTPYEYSALEKLSISERTSMHAVVVSAFLLASYESDLVDKNADLKTAVSLRTIPAIRREANGDLGCYISVASTQNNLLSKSLFEISRAYQGKILKSIIGECLQVNAIPFADMKSSIDKNLKRHQFYMGVGISDLGRIEVVTQYEKFKVVDFIPIACRVSGATSIVLHAYSFLEEGRFILNYTSPLLAKKTVEAVGKRIISILREALSDLAENKLINT